MIRETTMTTAETRPQLTAFIETIMAERGVAANTIDGYTRYL